MTCDSTRSNNNFAPAETSGTAAFRMTGAIPITGAVVSYFSSPDSWFPAFSYRPEGFLNTLLNLSVSVGSADLRLILLMPSVFSR